MADYDGNASKRIEKTLEGISAKKSAPKIGFAIILLLSLAASFVVFNVSHADGVVFIFGNPTPIRSLAGVFSSIANICFIFLVLFYGKPGFFTTIVIMMFQVTSLVVGMIRTGDFSTIPGLFTSLVTIFASVLIYMNNDRIKKYQKRIVDQAVTDRLTGLPNRFAFAELVNGLIANGDTFAIACINLNNFKSINNTLGSTTGNEVLVEMAHRLSAKAKEGRTGTFDFVVYLGADEFGLVIRDHTSFSDISNTLEQYEAAIEQKLTLDGCDLFLTSSMGWAEYPLDATDADTLLTCADTAMQEAKHHIGSSSIYHYEPNMQSFERALEIERTLRTALANDSLNYRLQPQYDMDHKLSGFEALARLNDSEGNRVTPAEFIPVAEKVGIIDQVDNAVFKKSAEFFGKLIQKTNTDITLSVNVSVKHLMKNDFISELESVLKSSGVPANQLEIEITESIMIDSAEQALQCIEEIKSLGVKIAIDDFGTGYSSLSYLNTFPADMLKVDKSFIDQLDMSDTSKQYVAAIISIGHVMNYSVISEGVEQPEQLETLRTIGCDYIQGFIWGRPLTPEAAEELVMQSMA